MSADLFLSDFADSLRDLRSTDRVKIGVLTEMVKTEASEESRPALAEIIKERIRTVRESALFFFLSFFFFSFSC